MPNSIKYSTSAQTLALKKGNYWIGTGDVGKGPTSVTDYYNGITPPSGGYTIYLNKASGGPSIYTAANDSQLISLTNTISVSTNLIKNNNGGNFADGTIAPFTGGYGTLPTIVDISNDKPYTGSASTKAANFVAGGGMLIGTSPSPFTMTAGVTYTFSFWYRQTTANNFYIGFNNQGGSGDINGKFEAYSPSPYNMFANPTQTWQRCSWTFTNVVDKYYFIINSQSSVAGSECLMTEFTLTEGAMPGGPGLTTAGNCLNWFATQADKMVFNLDYPAIVTDGLVLNLDAGFSPSFATIPSNANLSTVTPWYDLSGNGNNGTLTNGPTYSSTNGGSIVFDGADDYVNCGSNASLDLGSFTQEVWFKPTISRRNPLFGDSNNNGSDSAHAMWLELYNNNRFILIFGDGITYGDVYSTTIVQNNNIINVVCTRNNTSKTVQFYINGVAENSQSWANQGTIGTPVTLGTYSLWIGGSNGFGNMKDNIYIARIYNRILSSAEITQNYNASKGRFGL
jgi:hypothetical protein